MIITCPNCKKKFKIEASLVPDEGRNLQCGSCDHTWFYKAEDQNLAPLTLNEDPDKKEVDVNFQVEIEKKVEEKKKLTEEKLLKKEKKIEKNFENENPQIKKGNKETKFFSYLIVFIISFVAMIILLDTLKVPLINVFPGIELILFNLFETLKDIKLFIIDLI
tara:strand:+ start:124 stop:612 length:489 start_codon:yes stop_codon:yes gene_type:complete